MSDIFDNSIIIAISSSGKYIIVETSENINPEISDALNTIHDIEFSIKPGLYIVDVSLNTDDDNNELEFTNFKVIPYGQLTPLVIQLTNSYTALQKMMDVFLSMPGRSVETLSDIIKINNDSKLLIQEMSKIINEEIE